MLLALETALDQCSVALISALDTGEPTLLASRKDDRPREQTRLILPMIEAVLHDVRQPMQAIEAVAFSRGPGSFSGIRINTAVAQALAWVHQWPVIPVSTLRALALTAFEALPTATHVLTALDARMNEVYVAPAIRSSTRLVELTAPEQLVAYGQVTLPVGWSDETRLVGQGAPLTGLQSVHIHADLQPDAVDVGRLAWYDWQAGFTVTPAEALPLYLRDDAWKKKTPLE